MGITYKVNGRTVEKLPVCAGRLEEMLAAHQPPKGHHPACWPMTSRALGVNPEQIPEAMAAAAEAGCPTRFVESGPKAGDAILESPSHRKALSHSIGFHDRNAGYSDPTPESAKRAVESKHGPEPTPEYI